MSVATKVTKSACPAIRPSALLRVRALHRRSEGRLTRAVPGPLSLSPHPCGSPLYATIPLTLLKGRLELPESHVSSPAPTLCVGANPVRSSSQSCRPVQNNEWTEGMGTINARSARKSHQATRSPNPVRRPSGGVAQGDEPHGCGERTRRPRLKGHGRPLCAGPRSGAGGREVWRRSRQTRMSGCAFFCLLFFVPGGDPQTKKSKAPCRAQSVALCRGKCCVQAIECGPPVWGAANCPDPLAQRLNCAIPELSVALPKAPENRGVPL